MLVNHARNSKILSLVLVSLLLSSTVLSASEKAPFYDIKDLTSPYTSWGIDPENKTNINLLGAWKKFEKHKEVIVGVVDTGIDPEHKFLANNIFVQSGRIESTNFGKDYSKPGQEKNTPMDVEGHGSHISGIIKSVYPDVKLLSVKYYDSKASGEENLTATIKALKYAVDQNVDLINYSGGGAGMSERELAILKEAEKKDILVIVAAGNKSANIDDKKNAFYPASYGLKNVITVTAYDESLEILDSSNYGPKSVDIGAPGFRIKSSLQNGRAGYLTGTSQATAFVTGVAALIKSKYPQIPNFRVKEIIKASAKKELSLKDKCVTGGRLDADAALSLADKEAPSFNNLGRVLAEQN